MLPTATQWEMTIADLPVPTVTLVNGLASGWLRAQLAIALPPGQIKIVPGQWQIERTNLLLDHAFAGATAIDRRAPFSPFAQGGALPNFFYLNVEEAFVRAGATVTVAMTLAQSGRASSDLVLNWSYSDGNNGWRPLGISTPTNATSGSTIFADDTLAFTQDGAVRFTVPADWRPQSHFGTEGRWLRVQISAGDYGTGLEVQLPQIATLTAGYVWQLPAINQIEARVRIERSKLAPELGFTNTLPLDLSKDFYPFGEKPRLSDTLYLAHQAVLALRGAVVTIDVTLSNPRQPQPATWPIAPVTPSADLEIIWEVWDGQRWVTLGKGKSLLAASLLEPYVTHQEAGTLLVFSGQAPLNTQITIEERHTGDLKLPLEPNRSGRYRTELDGVKAGLHTFLVHFEVPNRPPMRLWAPFALLEPGQETVPLTVQPVATVTGDRSVVFARGGASQRRACGVA